MSLIDGQSPLRACVRIDAARLRRPKLLGRGNSKQDDVLRVDPDALAGVRVIEPRELHDRAAGCVENRALDILSRALDSVALATDDGDLSRDRRPA